MLNGYPFWAFILFAVSALSDGLDGYLARRLKQITDFGKFADPLADKILVISILIVLVEAGAASSIPVILIVIREIAISGWRLIKARDGAVVAASWPAKIKTVLQLLATGMLIISLPNAEIVLWLAVIASIISGIDYVRQN
ncbi:CDP-diacylglycerol--glycerol-3-phosphate 3-phosphatidyltransferase [Candidatus Margulisiibacteriota bacterium]